MADDLLIPVESLSKKEKYEQLLPQIAALLEGESDVIANISNIISALKFGMNWFWVGVYFVKKNKSGVDELVLGPFQGPVACTRIGFGKGVCGASWKNQELIIVDDVEKFPGHIACSSLSKSEIVLPAFNNNQVALVLDVDSEDLNMFDGTDKQYLQTVIGWMEKML